MRCSLTKNYFNFTDTVQPVITFTDAPSVTNKNPRFSWRSTEYATFECSFDGRRYENCGEGKAGFWAKSNVGDGGHVLLVRGRDLAGNLGTSIPHRWTVGKISNTTYVYT